MLCNAVYNFTANVLILRGRIVVETTLDLDFCDAIYLTKGVKEIIQTFVDVITMISQVHLDFYLQFMT